MSCSEHLNGAPAAAEIYYLKDCILEGEKNKKKERKYVKLTFVAYL